MQPQLQKSAIGLCYIFHVTKKRYRVCASEKWNGEEKRYRVVHFLMGIRDASKVNAYGGIGCMCNVVLHGASSQPWCYKEPFHFLWCIATPLLHTVVQRLNSTPHHLGATPVLRCIARISFGVKVQVQRQRNDRLASRWNHNVALRLCFKPLVSTPFHFEKGGTVWRPKVHTLFISPPVPYGWVKRQSLLF